MSAATRHPKPWALLGAALVALVTAGIILGFRHATDSTPAPASPVVFARLAGLPADGWTVSALPLGPTELVDEKAREVLQFDEMAYLHFRRGDREFTLYLAYWKPGKADLRTVNSHTPDSCWVNSGWVEQERRSGFTGAGDARPLPPGEYRCFTHNNVRQYVVFWHLLAGRPVPLAERGMPQLGYLLDLLRGEAKGLGGEQYFVRIASPRPLEEIWSDPKFQDVLRVLAPIGIGAGPGT